MENLARHPSKKPDGKHLRVQAHFESLEDEVLSETLDILASIICDYIERKDKNEQDNS